MKFDAEGHDARIPRSFHWILLGITLLCLIPRLIFGASQYIEYDGYWHVWIAQQHSWPNFIREYQANAHPPLYFLLLKLTFLLGRNNLAYRAISIASSAASIYILGLTAARIMRSPVWALLAALAYGIALPSILLSNEVRTYMLCAFFAQISFWYFLDLIQEARPSLRSRVLFGVMATLASLTEYYGLIYVGATLLFALLLILIRRNPGWLPALGREILTFALILALPVWEYVVHFGGKPEAYDHLPNFYFQPDGAESVVGFLLRNLRNELNGFSLAPVPEGSAFYVALGLLILAAMYLFRVTRRWSVPRNIAAMAVIVIPLFMLGAIMFGGIERVYPFGGFLRQQYILFPFFAICLFLLPDRLLSSLPQSANLAIAAVLAAGIGYASYQNYDAWPKSSRLLLSDQMSRYNRLFPSAPAIFIDQFNLTTFFMHHHDWDWEFVSPLPASETVDVYKLSRDGRSMMLFRDRDHWNLDLRDPLLFTQMARGMNKWHVPATTIFSLAQPVGRARTEAQIAAYRARVAEVSSAAGLCVQTLELDNYDVYAEFRIAGTCDAPRQ